MIYRKYAPTATTVAPIVHIDISTFGMAPEPDSADPERGAIAPPEEPESHSEDDPELLCAVEVSVEPEEAEPALLDEDSEDAESATLTLAEPELEATVEVDALEDVAADVLADEAVEADAEVDATLEVEAVVLVVVAPFAVAMIRAATVSSCNTFMV